MKKEYSQKEIQIFEGVIALAQRGENLYLLKVQQIAQEAGIGKGTLYEYFTSRDEIIASALVYTVNMEMSELEIQITNANSYEEKLCAAIDYAYNTVTSHGSSLALINSAMETPPLRKILCEHKDAQDEVMQRLFSILIKIIEKGRKESKINKDETDEYCLMTAISVLCTVAFSSRQEWIVPWMQIRSNALKMLCKALA